ncbi:MAG: T9SS type A sorting domain-containing protein [Bacteroidia bacterium]|nr:T9SS type A sorting domain-containing protein [Bacteroidia bacterium]
MKHSIAQNPNPRWLYVDNLAGILGTPYQAELITYLDNQNITYIAAYQVHEISIAHPCLLADFISQCHAVGTGVGAILSSPCSAGSSHVSIGTFWYDKYLNIVDYNNQSVTTLPAMCGSGWNFTSPQIDAIHIENEYWNMHPDDYNDMVTNMNSMISHRSINSTNIEFHIHMARYPSGGSWPSVATQAGFIADNFNVVQVVNYASDENKLLDNTLNIVKPLLDNTTKSQLNVSILFSNLCNASGDWLRSNSWNHDLLYADKYTNKLNAFNSSSQACSTSYYGCNQSKLNLMPPTWFSYSFEFSFPDILCDGVFHPNHPENSTSNLSKEFGTIETLPGGAKRNASQDRVVIQPPQLQLMTNLHQLTDPFHSYTFEAWINVPAVVLSTEYATNNTIRTLFVNYSYSWEITEDDIIVFAHHPVNGFRIALDNSNHLMVASPNFTDASGNTFYMPPANYSPTFTRTLDEIRVTDDNALPTNNCLRVTVKVTYLAGPDRQVIDFYVNGVHSSQKTIAVHLNGNAIGDHHRCLIGGDPLYWVTNPVTATQFLNCSTTCNVPPTFVGLIDDVKIWDTSLDNSIITAIPSQSMYNNNRDLFYWKESDHLVSNWRFDERFQNRIVIDNSHNNYDGFTSVNGIVYPFQSLPSFPAISGFDEQFEPKGGVVSCYAYETQVGSYFDGDKKVIELASASSTNGLNLGTGEFFLEALINAEYSGQEQTILSNRNASGTNGFLWGIDANGRMFFQFGNNAATRITTDPLDPLNILSNIGFDIYDHVNDDYTFGPVPLIQLSDPDILLFNGCHHVGVSRVIEGGLTYMCFYIDEMRSRFYRSSTAHFSFITADITSGAADYLCGWDETARNPNLSNLSYKGLIDDVRIFNISDATRWYNYRNYVSPGSYAGYGADPGLVENESYFIQRGGRILEHYNGGSCAVDLNFEDYKRDSRYNYHGSRGNQLMNNGPFTVNSNMLANAILGNTPTAEFNHDPMLTVSCSNVSSSVPELKGPGPGPKPELSAQTIGFSNLIAYPNPFSDIITFQSTETISLIEAFDISGRSVTIDLRGDMLHTGNWSKGMYIIRVTTTGQLTTTFKMIK